jgi:hypothetical protein
MVPGGLGVPVFGGAGLNGIAQFGMLAVLNLADPSCLRPVVDRMDKAAVHCALAGKSV